MGCGSVSFVFLCWVLVCYVISNCMVSGVGVWFPLGRVYLGHSCFWCVLGDRPGLGNPVIELARGSRRCLWLGCCFGGYGGLVGSHVRYVGFSFFLMFFVLVHVRAVMYPRRCMLYYVVPGPHC